MKKVVFSCIMFLCVLLTCNACQNPIIIERKPCNQPNTKWESEDGTIVFSVDSKEYYATGEMIIDGNTIEFFLTNDMGTGMWLFAPEVLDTKIETTENEYECWMCSYKSKNEFTATVEKTTYFKVGDKIKFHRIDDTSDKKKTTDDSVSS